MQVPEANQRQGERPPFSPLHHGLLRGLHGLGFRGCLGGFLGDADWECGNLLS